MIGRSIVSIWGKDPGKTVRLNDDKRKYSVVFQFKAAAPAARDGRLDEKLIGKGFWR